MPIDSHYVDMLRWLEVQKSRGLLRRMLCLAVIVRPVLSPDVLS